MYCIYLSRLGILFENGSHSKSGLVFGSFRDVQLFYIPFSAASHCSSIVFFSCVSVYNLISILHLILKFMSVIEALALNSSYVHSWVNHTSYPWCDVIFEMKYRVFFLYGRQLAGVFKKYWPHPWGTLQ